MKKLFIKVTPESTSFLELSVLIPRVFLGLAMALTHGLGKVPPPEQLISGVQALGFPAPVAFAWAAGLAECAGGILLALGLLTRPAAIFLSFTMLVAAFGAHLNDPFGVKEMSLLYLVGFLMFAIRGGGKWSVDHYIK